MKFFILADNQEITREGTMAVLKQSGIVFQALHAKNRTELHAALKRFPEAVVVLDYTLFDFSSVQQMIVTREGAPASRWVLFSDELGPAFLRLALYTDPTMSVVFKTDSKAEITEALLGAADGERYICPMAGQMLREGIPVPGEPDRLTPAEKSILHEIALGKTTKEIAWEKNLSFHTVNSHRKNIFRKLEVNNVHEAIKYALRAGIIDQAEYHI